MGNRAALYSRSFIQNCLYNLGCLIQRHSLKVIFLVFVVYAFCLYGLQFVRIETDIVKLWVSEGGRLDEELNYFKRVQDRYSNVAWTAENNKYFVKDDDDLFLRQRTEDESASPGYQVLIQTANQPEGNLLTREGLNKHVRLLQHLVDLRIEKYGTNWTLSDICFKPGGLDIASDSIAYSMKPMLERLIPCIWITPIDCFYEGSGPIGPHPPIDTSSMQALISLFVDIPELATWSNINPEKIIKVLSDTFDLGTVKDFFLRTGIGAGYLDRPCINPLDPNCPKQAPNYYDACPAMTILKRNLTAMGQTLDDLLEKEEEKKSDNFAMDILGSFFGFGGNEKAEEDAANGTETMNSDVNETVSVVELDDATCKTYRKSFLKWIDLRMQEAEALFGASNMPVFPDFSKVMNGGCKGFARSVLNWPQDMILGGVRDVGNGSIEAEALQSVLLVSTPTDVYRRLRGSEKVANLRAENSSHLHDVGSEWCPDMAAEVISEWQRVFTHSIYNHELNFHVDSSGEVIEKRVVHPLASTSISDMLAEFCDFNYGIIFIGYFLMLVYAVYSQMRLDGFCLLSPNSSMGLAVAGVFTVTFASVSGLGLATWFGIEFNAATTQIVPFLTLGIGVDNMFLLLHNYPQVTSNSRTNEIGLLMKETGMSILMTSLNNILAFFAGTMLPIPALRSFCTQSSILLMFNLFAILTMYPAIIALDLRRRKSRRRDVCCCFIADDVPDMHQKEHAYGMLLDRPSYHGLISNSQEDMDDEEVEVDRLQAFLRNYYIPFVQNPAVKFFVVVVAISLFSAGLVGLQHSQMGLELSDVLPDHTAPAAFLKARDKYFSFYPMSIILRGEDLDFAHQQHLIQNLRREIGNSQYVVKIDAGEPSERYWLGLFQEWLIGLQSKLDVARAEGLLDDFDNKNSTNELKIAVSMICSFGYKYDCSRVQQGVKLIDASNTINEEGFYNYLYAWHEYESMFYTVSQANFYPKLFKLRQGPAENRYRFFIPPASQPRYSQIPFYLTGLKDTPGIIAMIKEIRAICDKYTDAGLDNYPSGIAFTFWEQYLDLNRNLTMAISLIAFAVFCVISLLLFNPWAASCIIVILLMMTVELAGFIGMCGIKLNPVSAVSLITTVGIGVEFTAHVVFAFLTSVGTRNERMAACIDKVFVPVIHGALSTMLGILMLGFSEFEFVFKYFFVIMFALIIIGLINGLAVLPVLLSLVGPSCEMRPSNGSNRLATPSPLPKNRAALYSHGLNNKKTLIYVY